MIETMQKRIEEIKQADRKAYYELANEIGISEYSLYSFMTRDECSANTENKINSYLRGYLTKDEKLESYRMDNEELKAENERLKSEIKNNKSAYEVELGTYNMECGNLLEENKELAHYLACMTEQRNKANTCLQEIKAIAKAPSPYIDNFEIKTATEVGYDYAAICNELELRLHKVLELITKAESEE